MLSPSGAARRTRPGSLGLCEHDIVKSLVFDDGQGGHAVMALMHGDERVSLHKLQRLSGVPHLQPSSPENAERLTGYKPGGICPFGLSSPLPVFAQSSLFERGTLYINAGERGVIAVIRPDALRLAGAVRQDHRAAAPAIALDGVYGERLFGIKYI